MKNTSSSIFLLSIISIILLSTHFKIAQSDANLIAQTCKQTPNYNLCLSTLKSDPRSSKADVTGLAIIMVDKLKAQASATQKLIKEEIGKNPRFKKELSACSDYYDAILTADVPEAFEALTKGDPKFAQDGANDAANEANSCELHFNGRSPLSKFNKAVHDTSTVASAIIRLLL